MLTIINVFKLILKQLKATKFMFIAFNFNIDLSFTDAFW
jgi:hypothetical protein